jgi:hypothetical protein
VSHCVPLRCHHRYKGDLVHNPSHFSASAISSLLPCALHPLCIQLLPQNFTSSPPFPTMATSHPYLFQQSIAVENKIFKLVKNHFLSYRVVLQWRPAIGEDIPTPNTKEIMVFSSFFLRGFGLPAYFFLHGLLDHYKIELT